MIVPILGLMFYIIRNSFNLANFSNRLDIVFTVYAIYGLVFLFFNSLIAEDMKIIFRDYVHIYLPVIFYFLSKHIIVTNPKKTVFLFKFIVFISFVLAIDIIIEIYIISVLDLPEKIPWMKFSLQNSELAGNIMWDTQGQIYKKTHYYYSIMGNSKAAGLAIASLGAFIYPFLFKKKDSSNIIILPTIYIRILFMMLVTASILLPSTSNTLSLLFALPILTLVSSRRVKGGITLIGVYLITYVIFYENINQQIMLRLFTYNINNLSAVEYIFSLDSLIDYVTDVNILPLIFGSHTLPSHFPMTPLTELDLLLLPFEYGLIWSIIVIVGLKEYLSTCRKLIYNRLNNILNQTMGLAALGFIIVYASNLHYPKILFHGNIELFFMISGIISGMSEHGLMARHSKKFLRLRSN
jgi:hypothetical protein